MKLRLTLRRLGFIWGVVVASQGAHASDAGTRIQTIAKDLIHWTAVHHPVNATYLGLIEYDGELVPASKGHMREELAKIAELRQRLSNIPLTNATLMEKGDVRLLLARLTTYERAITRYKTWDKDYAGPANEIVNVLFEQFEYLPIEGREGATKRDVDVAWNHMISRLEKSSAYIESGQNLVTHPGHLFGVVGVQELEGAPGFLSGPLTETAKTQLDVPRLKRFLAARDSVLKTIAATLKHIKNGLPHWPENYAMGATAYGEMLRDELLLPYDAKDIQQMGLDELGHGAAVQSWLWDEAKAKGTAIGPDTGGGLATEGEGLVGYYRDRIAELKKYMIDRQIVTIPDWLGDMKVVETPKFLQPVSPGASMQSPRVFAIETTGFYYITPSNSLADSAKRLDANQDFDRDRIWSTSAHEAMPGHFLQLSIARRHSDYVRATQDSGVFAEGWAYYGEEMFVQLGMYGDDLDARYYTAQWERVRGCRAIVDAKLASGEWSYDKAVDFFAKNCGFSTEASKAAVAGIALGPGYVLAYTVGRLQLQNLLTEYGRRMGTKGSLHDFHDRLLSYGTTPFSVMGPELLADLNKSSAQVRAVARY